MWFEASLICLRSQELLGYSTIAHLWLRGPTSSRYAIRGRRKAWQTWGHTLHMLFRARETRRGETADFRVRVWLFHAIVWNSGTH